jgi:hypothetical protein
MTGLTTGAGAGGSEGVAGCVLTGAGTAVTADTLGATAVAGTGTGVVAIGVAMDAVGGGLATGAAGAVIVPGVGAAGIAAGAAGAVMPDNEAVAGLDTGAAWPSLTTDPQLAQYCRLPTVTLSVFPHLAQGSTTTPTYCAYVTTLA